MVLRRFCLSLLLPFTLFGIKPGNCATPPSTLPPSQPTPAALVAANNAFGFHLYAELAKKDGQKNLFISPLSLEYCLAMVANGAKGETYSQMAQTLGWGTTPLPDINVGFKTLTSSLPGSDPQVRMTLANSLWLAAKDSFRDAYLQTNKQYFNAEMSRVSFTDPATVPNMNKWVSEHTQGMIPKIVEEGDVDGGTSLVLLNALFFKGAWMVPFDAKLTTDRPFTLADGTLQTVPMMRQSGTVTYCEDNTMQMVKLPYGDGSMSMLIILPRRGQTLNAVAQTVFADANWAGYRARLAQRQGEMSLPRFKADYAIVLNDALKALGMVKAFGGGDFSGISDVGGLFISIVRHKTALEVNEEGSKAAAATEVVMARGHASHPPVLPFTMTVDHPFLFAIQHKDGTILFLGSITKPE